MVYNENFWDGCFLSYDECKTDKYNAEEIFILVVDCTHDLKNKEKHTSTLVSMVGHMKAHSLIDLMESRINGVSDDVYYNCLAYRE